MDFQKISQRSDETMLSLILSVANEDERIRAVTMNGSRANPNAPKDRYQDFDVVYFATDIKPFVEDTRWLDVFGERVIMQTPDDWNIFLPYDDPNRGKHFGFLMQFMDGNRIDLTVAQLSLIPELTADSETIVLLDKDHLLSGVPEASDRDYWAKKPDANHFYGTCNEFLWVSTYVAKGLARKEISFAKTGMEQYVRDALLQILEHQNGFFGLHRQIGQISAEISLCRAVGAVSCHLSGCCYRAYVGFPVPDAEAFPQAGYGNCRSTGNHLP